jgi:molybdate transport system substrate-binding protein
VKGSGAAGVRVLSPSAVHSSLEAIVEAHRERGGGPVELNFETAPRIVRRLGAGDAFDLVIAPPKVMIELAGTGKTQPGKPVPLGRVGVGISVRAGAPAPDISSTAALTRALLDADAIFHTQASSGIYAAQLLERLGVAAQRGDKIRSYHDAQETFTHMLARGGRDIGFGGIPEIRRWQAKGVRYVGPLPEDIQNYTSYLAALAANPGNRDGARAFLEMLGSPAAKTLLAANGVDPA